MLSKLGMIDMSSATKVLTSTLKGFKLEANEAQKVVDKLTRLDMKFATSAGEIGEAISRTAAIAQETNLSLDQTAAIVTTIMDVTQQSAEMTGTALRSILSRYGNVKPGAFASMISEEDLEGINDIEKVLNKIGIQIRENATTQRAFGDVLDDLNKKWINLTDVEKNAVATAMAGTRQRNAFITLMENYDKYKDALKESQNAEGTAAEKYQAYMDSIEYKLQQLQVAWEKLSQEFLTSDMFKNVIDFTTKLIEQLPTIIKYVATLTSAISAYKLPAWLNSKTGINLMNLGQYKGAVSSLFSGYKTSYTGMKYGDGDGDVMSSSVWKNMSESDR